MAIILNIDSSQETASVCLARDESPLLMELNENQSDHASWIHTAIQNVSKTAGIALQQLDAVAVTIGPGSYTGLRVGLATAKGICYALNLPLITISTLKMMANAAKKTATGLICPMIDARRMEVYAALYDKNLSVLSAEEALILDETTYHSFLAAHPILFCGSGSKKLQPLIHSPHARFGEIQFNALHLTGLSFHAFTLREFASLAYAEPVYIKEFYTKGRRK
ncbi:MAG: tRNA (adenosine(37)-N6)-threonylcarbamoyltransferase complex dimerization subunit type 1 TsaB [Sphingobacteriales bacterium]|nr:tRNA (adenosine(37)-N6)-threonylcarbamoyltransferase complex dimerization subunit type 1 TsaB [Sphingobacteriales bacterium]